MFTLLSILVILACLFLIFLVIIQKSKGGGIATNLQSGMAITQQFGVVRGTNLVEKATWYTIALIALLSFLLNVFRPEPVAEAGATQGIERVSTPAANTPAPAPAE